MLWSVSTDFNLNTRNKLHALPMRYVNKMTISWPYWYNLEQNVFQSTKSYFQQRRVLSQAWSIPAQTQEMGSLVLLWEGVTRVRFNPWIGTILWRRKWYSCLGNPMDRGAWQATVHGVVKSQTWLITHACIRVQAVNEKERTTSFSRLKRHWDPAWVKGG